MCGPSQRYDLCIAKGQRAQELWVKVAEHRTDDERLAHCIEWARGFVQEQRLYRGLILGWLGMLDSAFEDFTAVASSPPCQTDAFTWVVPEAHICVGHALAKYQSSGQAVSAEISDCAKVTLSQTCDCFDVVCRSPCIVPAELPHEHGCFIEIQGARAAGDTSTVPAVSLTMSYIACRWHPVQSRLYRAARTQLWLPAWCSSVTVR